MFASGPKVLIVTAHPDDETAFAATIYKVTHDLNGLADILLVTNGEGGYKYSTLAEDIYGRELTDEQSGRKALPTIRKKELMAGGEYIGLRDYYFMDQKDTGYTLDADSVLNIVWDTSIVIRKIKELHGKNNYDYVFTLLPVQGTHGHHKAASILALRAVKSMESKMFYAKNAIEQNWGKRELRNQITRKAFERNEIANIQISSSQPELLNTFKDPFMLDFLNLKNKYLCLSMFH
jgi:LmbE family N-acetylglucosaminyl deacetylase